jgi:hypothetical protein
MASETNLKEVVIDENSLYKCENLALYLGQNIHCGAQIIK